MPVFLSLHFSNGKRSREVPIGSPFDELFFSASMALPPFFKEIRNGREKLLIGVSNSVAHPDGSGPNGNLITLVFPFTFMDSIKDGLGPESLQTHFFLLIIALLDLGGIRYLLSCCVLHILGFFESCVPW